MISLDWKQRLKMDTEDFVSRKIPQGDFDIDIVYNAYPKRIDNKIPSEVITFVAKILASKIAKNMDQYLNFYDYLWYKKGENGKQIFVYLMKTAIHRKPAIFLDYVKKVLATSKDVTDINAVLNKAVVPLFKKESKKYLDIIYNWLSLDNPDLHKSIINLFIKVAKNDPTLLKYIFQKMERGWLYPNPHTIKNSVQFLKATYKIDADFYFSVYDNYKGSRNPVFVEILCHALNPISEPEPYNRIVGYLENWQKSGNIRIKKAAATSLKTMKKKSK
ncbi:MAG: hypothetical protein K0B81_08315 [Candidatus Cloacimonetes bacterium]|nr:hypothetical protein [Candidatus Cloacimonadota bacterium]